MTTEAGRRSGRLRLVAQDGVSCGGVDRAAQRYRTFLAGKLRRDDGGFVLCVVRDMSKSGARLVVDPSAKLSTDVELHVLSRNEIFNGTVVWREDDIVGIRFTAWTKI
ncbi:MAG: hypothetical protein JWN07_3273 [Hyphomicrobiales bacterium]|nr:hypothetical protein [Hyphomicrobiales bacterium]